MQYNGIELKDIADTPQLVNPPREMLVWDDCDLNPLTRLVFAITVNENEKVRVITEYVDGKCERFAHCAEIPEKPKKRATYRQVSKWLADGNGEACDNTTSNCPAGWCKTSLLYDKELSNTPCNDSLDVRKWDDTEWHEPTLEYLGLEA